MTRQEAKIQFSTIVQTRAYFAYQRTILFGFFMVNMLRPYLAAIVPLFVITGSKASGLETYFYGLIFLIGIAMWMLMKYVSHSYPKECGQNIVNYFETNENNGGTSSKQNSVAVDRGSVNVACATGAAIVATSNAVLQHLQIVESTAPPKRISAPSLLKCICFLEGWREAEVVRKVTVAILFTYGFYLLYLYLNIATAKTDIAQQRQLQEQQVSPSTVTVLYITFLITLYSLYTYEGPFFEEMVSNPTASATFMQDRRKRMEEQENKRKSKRMSTPFGGSKPAAESTPEPEAPPSRNLISTDSISSTKGSSFLNNIKDNALINNIANLNNTLGINDTEINKKIMEQYQKQKDGFFHDIGVLRKLFTTTFPDECFPLHLTIGDIFTDSSDLLAQLKTCASIVDHFHREQALRESTLERRDLENQINDEDEEDEGLRASMQRNGKFSGPMVVTVDELAVDPRFRDINWEIFTEGVLPPHVQINFLRMLHVFFMEGLGDHVGEFLEENQVSGRRLAKMITTVDESSLAFECSFIWKGITNAWSMCCGWRERQRQRQRQMELFQRQSITEDSLQISFEGGENPMTKNTSHTTGIKTTINKK